MGKEQEGGGKGWSGAGVPSPLRESGRVGRITRSRSGKKKFPGVCFCRPAAEHVQPIFFLTLIFDSAMGK